MLLVLRIQRVPFLQLVHRRVLSLHLTLKPHLALKLHLPLNLYLTPQLVRNLGLPLNLYLALSLHQVLDQLNLPRELLLLSLMFQYRQCILQLLQQLSVFHVPTRSAPRPFIQQYALSLFPHQVELSALLRELLYPLLLLAETHKLSQFMVQFLAQHLKPLVLRYLQQALPLLSQQSLQQQNIQQQSLYQLSRVVPRQLSLSQQNLHQMSLLM